ncbi:MAG: cytochrome c oxidase subunit 3 [Candidatus Lindowbacteria bacterium]|nr:cytochrome c oxidase subunit 3 [Candidatus Lindowbacteria bacterium]
MEIPYMVKPRPDTGLSNAKLGIWLFLASEVMLFGALFSSYILLRVGAGVEEWALWQEHANQLSVPMAFINTLVLIASSYTMVMSWAELALKNTKKHKMFLAATFALSCVFLVIKAFEYSGKFSHHLYPSSSTFLAIYFTITGLHGLHIIGGMVVMAYFLLPPGATMYKTEPERFTGRIEVLGLYWHFVDLVWIFLFPVLYLL